MKFILDDESEISLHSADLNSLPEIARHNFNKQLLFARKAGAGDFVSVNEATDRLLTAVGKAKGKDMIAEIREAAHALDVSRRFCIAGFSPEYLAFACLEKGRTDFSEEALAETVAEWKAKGLTYDLVKAYCDEIKKKLLTESQRFQTKLLEKIERVRAYYETTSD